MKRLKVDNRMFKVIRKQHHLTMHDMANLLEISQSYVARIEGNYEPVTDNVQKKLVSKFSLTSKKMREITNDYDKYSIVKKEN